MDHKASIMKQQIESFFDDASMSGVNDLDMDKDAFSTDAAKQTAFMNYFNGHLSCILLISIS